MPVVSVGINSTASPKYLSTWSKSQQPPLSSSGALHPIDHTYPPTQLYQLNCLLLITMEDVPESDVMLDQFNEKLKSSVHLSSYSAIQVLVFYWEEAETTYRDEAQAVRLMFQDTFNYPVTECAIPSSRSYFRVMNVLSEVLATKKAASSLLIIHYGGHGDNDDNRKEGGERRSVWAAYEDTFLPPSCPNPNYLLTHDVVTDS